MTSQLHAEGRPRADIMAIQGDHDVAVHAFGHLWRADGKPFVCHLIGTASAVAEAGLSITVVRAALLHALYSQGDLGRPSTQRSRRTRYRGLLGPDLEQLLASYDSWQWFPDGLSAALQDPPGRDEPLGQLVTMRLANELDDQDAILLTRKSASPEHQAVSLRQMSQLASRLALPTIAARLVAAIEQPADPKLQDYARPLGQSQIVVPPSYTKRSWARPTAHRALAAARRVRNLRHR